MSWSCSFANRKAFDAKQASPSIPTAPEMKEQFDVAYDAAKKVIESGSVGDQKGKDFAVYLSGHANQNHEPSIGYANDSISVSVSQIGNLEGK
jgi:hypothetical protein